MAALNIEKVVDVLLRILAEQEGLEKIEYVLEKTEDNDTKESA